MATEVTVTNVSKTLSDMRTTVYFLISESPNSTLFSSTNVNAALNMGFANVSKLFNRAPTEIYRTLDGTEYEWELPDAALQYGIAVVDNAYINDEAIVPIGKYDADSESGTPDSYYVEGKVFGLSPRPDGEYELKIVYRKELEPLANDADEVDLPDTAINAAIMYACYILKLKDEEFRSADGFLAEYESLLKNTTMLQSGVYKAGDLYGQNKYSGAV